MSSDMIINAVIDLSHWNENINFKLAREDGILGVIHKATQGLKYIDPTYTERRKAAEEEGLLWGSYHFGVGEDGRDQANHFLNIVGETKNTIVVLDIEENESGKNIEPRQAEDFVKKVQEETGRSPLVYGSANFLKDFGNVQKSVSNRKKSNKLI
ncbi:glycoside hydrolase family 25 protein [Wolbachia endosymbiont (group B) of Protocalliphora azurea]|uniref:glycoside hydrolase family 25 protein n=1 Tax=Wolbachia endosymbiont (group B) of Protocalliphora azurea TaxID=2954051 RepID=UPI00222E7265|nr:glycoside hydrolase family 25 protein [Wolbachia endosymbiont (group B) of Protocalliphora azurea]